MLHNYTNETDPLEPIEKEVIDWEKYYGEIFLRFSQVIDRLKDKLPRLRMVLRNRKNLNMYLQRVRESFINASNQEEQNLLRRKAQNQIREIRSALVHCYTAIVAFEDAFDRTIELIERIPEDNHAVSKSSPSTLRRMVSEEELLNELQRVNNLISSIDTKQIGEMSGDGNKTENEDMSEKIRIGDILLEEGIITAEQLNQALLYQKQSSFKEHLGTILIRLGFVDDVTIAKILAKQSGYSFSEDLRNEVVHSMALRVIPQRLVRQHECMPLQIRGNTLRIAVSNPFNLLALEDLKLASNCSLDIVVAPKSQIIAMIRKYYTPM